MRMVAFPVLNVEARIPALLPIARQCVSVRSTLPAAIDDTPNAVLHSEAVQSLSNPVASAVPRAERKTPLSHSANRESCAARLAGVPPDSTRIPLSHFRTSVPVTKKLPPFGRITPLPVNSAIEQCST